jgi:ribonuclease P protein component
VEERLLQEDELLDAKSCPFNYHLFMLPKNKRLKRADFSNLSSLKVFTTPYFDVKYSSKEDFKVSCIVIKKRFKKATERNKVKRKLYNAVKEVYTNQTGYFLFYPKKQIEFITLNFLIEEIKKLQPFK